MKSTGGSIQEYAVLKRCFVLGLMVFSAVVVADPVGSVGEASLRSLGETNGVALACRYLEQTRRIKAAVVESVPKERRYGLVFDQATNEGYLGFVQAQRPCPMPVGFMELVNQKIVALDQAFAAQSAE